MRAVPDTEGRADSASDVPVDEPDEGDAVGDDTEVDGVLEVVVGEALVEDARPLLVEIIGELDGPVGTGVVEGTGAGDSRVGLVGTGSGLGSVTGGELLGSSVGAGACVGSSVGAGASVGASVGGTLVGSSEG